MRAAFRFRLRLILVGVALVALLILGKLYFVQIVKGEEYSLKADRQYVASGSQLFNRGTIYFSRKDGTLVSAASLATGFLVAVNPKLIDNPNRTYAKIHAVADGAISEAAFLKAATNTEAVYVEIAHRLGEGEGKAVAALDLDGVLVLRERWRTYPGGELAAQTIGAVARSSEDDALRGRTGVEARYDETLSREGDGLYRNFFAELFANLESALTDASVAREGSVIMTLEPEVETRLASDVRAVHERYKSRESGGIIMDPRTGAIIAIASLPSYDANDLSGVPISSLTNPMVSHVYEFGSIMKPLTMAAALDAGVVTAKSTYNDTGCLSLDTSTICNFDKRARGVIGVREILLQSLNIGAAHLARQLGGPKLGSYFLKLGFGEKTGIDLPAETSGLVSNLESPREIEYATAAFGQGIAVTPLEMLRALGALANAGTIVNPHVARAVKLDSGIVRDLDWGTRGDSAVFSPSAVRDVSEMLTYVVDHNLSKGELAVPTHSIAAKTGTAQLTNQGGGYSSDRFFHSFFGYFPSYEPRFIILLYTYDPQGVQYASETLTTSFMDLARFMIEYYEIPPDRESIPV